MRVQLAYSNQGADYAQQITACPPGPLLDLKALGGLQPHNFQLLMRELLNRRLFFIFELRNNCQFISVPLSFLCKRAWPFLAFRSCNDH